MHTKDTLQIKTENGTLYAAPPRRFTGLGPAMPAQLEAHDETFSLSPLDAELLARTIAPQLFEPQGPGPWEAIYNDLTETAASYEWELSTSQTVEQVQDSLGTLLVELRESLREMRKLLPDE